MNAAPIGAPPAPEPEQEVWKPVPGIPYEASSLGRVRSVERDMVDKNGIRKHLQRKILKPSGRNGRRLHHTVCIWNKQSRYVHDLVAEAWIGPKPAGMLVLHANDDHENNRPDNLRYGSYSQNQIDRYHNKNRKLQTLVSVQDSPSPEKPPGFIPWSEVAAASEPDPDYLSPF